MSQRLYGIKPPTADPAVQRHIVRAADGTALFTETWLPREKDGNVPPAQLPTVLLFTPYAIKGVPGSLIPDNRMLRALVQRGYAFTIAHARGSGSSGGCIQVGGRVERRDGARIVEYLGRAAPWSNGRVGMQGYSQAGGTQFTVATSRDRDRVRYLKAIVPSAANISQYAFVMADGAPFFLGPWGTFGLGQAAATSFGLFPAGADFVAGRLPPALANVHERASCGTAVTAAAQSDGSFTPFWAERETRLHLDRIDAAVLLDHGISDPRVSVATVSGVLDRLPPTTPTVGVFGWWKHGPPDYRPHPGWMRADWTAMVVAWFDRHLKQLPSGVESWPRVQVQGSDGQWHAEDTWPRPDGDFGQLALSDGGSLGAGTPTGKSAYLEEPAAVGMAPRDLPTTSVSFETPPMPARLELTGEPVADLWLKASLPYGNIPVKLEALGPGGDPPLPEARNVGIRSIRFLRRLHDGTTFVQRDGVAPPVNRAIRVRVRLRPTDLVVPKGGSLRLTVGGSPGVDDVPSELGLPLEGPTASSGSPTLITVLHDCEHPSVLRFTTPPQRANLLNIRERDEGAAPLADSGGTLSPVSDGGGLAAAPVCGTAPSSPYAGL